jgi:hypothetical protein
MNIIDKHRPRENIFEFTKIFSFLLNLIFEGPESLI